MNRLRFLLLPGSTWRRLVADVGAVVLLLTVGIVGFAATFEGATYLVAAVGALVVGIALAWVGARWRWGVLTLAGATVAVYFLLGGALALPATTFLGVIPTLETWRQLAFGIVTAWKDLLTTVPPVAPDDGHLIVPFLMTLVASVLTASLALRLRRPAWALIPASAFIAGEILLGTAETVAPIVQGALFVIVAVVWLALRTLWSPERTAVEAATPGADASRAARLRRLVSGGVVVALATGGWAFGHVQPGLMATIGNAVDEDDFEEARSALVEAGFDVSESADDIWASIKELESPNDYRDKLYNAGRVKRGLDPIE